MANKFTAHTRSRLGKHHHFYATSVGEWRVHTDVAALIAQMKKDRYNFSVYMVPVPVTENYEIKDYMPQVEGVVWLGNYNYEAK